MIDYHPQMYDALAASLAHPPTWLAGPGCDWPLTRAAKEWARDEPAASGLCRRLGAIPSESFQSRQDRYQTLFAGKGKPIPLHESLWRDGRLAGPSAWRVESVYAAAGLSSAGSELPDHASLELSFLAFLAERQVMEPATAAAWRRVERRFIARHAGKWLPQVGQALARSGDTVYAPIGALMTLWLATVTQRNRPKLAAGACVPRLATPEECTLCGFCVQACPTRALRIHESASETTLSVDSVKCTGCRQCVGVCTGELLQIDTDHVQGLSVLRRSDRARCNRCGSPTVSEAELNFVRARIGDRSWLNHCVSCRSGPRELRYELSN